MNLPELNFVECDTDITRANIMTIYEGLTGVSLSPGDPVRILLESFAVIMGQFNVRLNEAAKQNTLFYARDLYLDYIGQLVETERLQSSTASMSVRFSIDKALDSVVNIPMGTRITSSNGGIYFSTKDVFEIPIGATYIDIEVFCEMSGEIGNGYLPGQITKLVAPVLYISSVENITTSNGGAEIEDDDSYRLRINTAPSSFSVAGPEAAYESFVRGAHQDISDVSISNPSPGKIDICFLMKDGELPSTEIKELVYSAVSAKTVRPLADDVNVIEAEEIPYSISIGYYISVDDLTNAENVKKSVEASKTSFILNQRSKLGKDINPDTIKQMLMNSGAVKVDILEPSFKFLSGNQVARETILNFEYLGALSDG